MVHVFFWCQCMMSEVVPVHCCQLNQDTAQPSQSKGRTGQRPGLHLGTQAVCLLPRRAQVVPLSQEGVERALLAAVCVAHRRDLEERRRWVGLVAWIEGRLQAKPCGRSLHVTVAGSQASSALQAPCKPHP